MPRENATRSGAPSPPKVHTSRTALWGPSTSVAPTHKPPAQLGWVLATTVVAALVLALLGLILFALASALSHDDQITSR